MPFFLFIFGSDCTHFFRFCTLLRSYPCLKTVRSIATYKADSYNYLQISGQLQVSADVDNLSDGYVALKNQVDQLLKQTQSENQIVLDLEKLQLEVNQKTLTLKKLNQDLEFVKAKLKKLKKFLALLGINPLQYALKIDDRVLQAVTLDEEIDPFDSDSDNSSDSDF